MATAPTGLDATLEAIAALGEAALARPWRHRGHEMDVRTALYWTLADAQDALVRAAARPHPESRRILALAQRAFGDLRGLLAGLSDDLLDRAPADGQWTIRQTLGHVIAVEQRYMLQTEYATERADADAVRIPPDRLPPLVQAGVPGGIAESLALLGAARAETNRRLGDLAPAAMTRPTVWVHYDVDVRFRLHRFAAHVAEHTIQCEKTLAAIGWAPGEGRRIARLLAAAHGELEVLGAPGDARAIETLAAERVA
jgi:hypothetical protein